MQQYEKAYLNMLVHVSIDGETRPVALYWQDDRRYEIDRVLCTFPAPPPHVGGILTTKYECVINGARRDLYLETQTNRWFLERPLV